MREHQSSCRLHRLFHPLIEALTAAIDLILDAGGHVVVARCAEHMLVQRVGPGCNGLRLQHFRMPGCIDLSRHHPFDIFLQVDLIDDQQPPSAADQLDQAAHLHDELVIA